MSNSTNPVPRCKSTVENFADRRSINPLPFVPLPLAALHDRKIDATDRDLLAALLESARNDVDCCPANRSLADAIGKSERTVQLSLARLQNAQWIRIEHNPHTGRWVILCWREQAQSAAPAQPLAAAPAQPVAPTFIRDENADKNRNVTAVVPSKHPTPRPTKPVAAAPVAPTAALPDRPVEPLRDALRGIPGGTPDQVRRVAGRLASALSDTSSIGFYIGVLAQVAAGVVTVEQVLAAYKAGLGAVGRSDRPGRLFTWTFKNYVPPPKPSEISRPAYHRAQVPKPEPVVQVSEAEEIEQLRRWAAQPRHPCNGHARRRLAQIEASAARY